MQILGQGLKGTLEPHNDDDDADILKVVQNLQLKLLTDDIISLILQFLVWNQTAITLIHNLSRQYRICQFSKT